MASSAIVEILNANINYKKKLLGTNQDGKINLHFQVRRITQYICM